MVERNGFKVAGGADIENFDSGKAVCLTSYFDFVLIGVDLNIQNLSVKVSINLIVPNLLPEIFLLQRMHQYLFVRQNSDRFITNIKMQLLRL